MLETVSLLCGRVRGFAAYVSGSGTLLNCLSSLREAIAADFGCVVDWGVLCCNGQGAGAS